MNKWNICLHDFCHWSYNYLQKGETASITFPSIHTAAIPHSGPYSNKLGNRMNEFAQAMTIIYLRINWELQIHQLLWILIWRHFCQGSVMTSWSNLRNYLQLALFNTKNDHPRPKKTHWCFIPQMRQTTFEGLSKVNEKILTVKYSSRNRFITFKFKN